MQRAEYYPLVIQRARQKLFKTQKVYDRFALCTKEEKNMKTMWIILAVNTFLSVTALRGLWNLIERVDNLQEWVEMLIGEASDVPDFTFKELGEIVREERNGAK